MQINLSPYSGKSQMGLFKAEPPLSTLKAVWITPIIVPPKVEVTKLNTQTLLTANQVSNNR